MIVKAENRLPISYDLAPLAKLFRDFETQVNLASLGRIQAASNAASAAPTTGTYQQGDFIRSSSPTKAGTVGSRYIVIGYVCTVAGTPGTWEEVRVLTESVVFPTENFNWSFNTDFHAWGAGTATVPTGWTANGASATYAKNTTAAQYKWGISGLSVTRAGTDCYASQVVDTMSGFGPVGAWKGKTVTLGAWVYATVASRARLSINDGVGTSNSSYHTGGSALEFLTVTRALDASATKVEMRLGVDTGNTTGVFSGVVFVYGSSVSDWIPPGWLGRKGVLRFGGTSSATAASTLYYDGGSFNANEQNSKYPVPFKCVARNLHTSTGTGNDPGVGNTYVYTIRKNGADTSITSTQSGAGSIASSDVSNEVAFAKADLLGMKLVTSAAANALPAQMALELEEIP